MDVVAEKITYRNNKNLPGIFLWKEVAFDSQALNRENPTYQY